MRILEFPVPEDWDGAVAKRFLRGYCNLSYRLMVRLKNRPGGITMDGAVLRTIDRVRAGATVQLAIPEEESSVEEVNLPLRIVWEDEDLLVIDKPHNMPVHPSPGHGRDTLANGVSAYLRQKGEGTAFRVLNRLDRDTTGLVLTVKNPYAAAKLTGTVEKRYFAVIEGELNGRGTIYAPLRTKEGHGIRREIGSPGERAVTHWTSMEVKNGYTLLCIRLETGRTHQIRAHFSCRGMPLAGDDMYDGSTRFLPRQALHCGWMRFVHPVTGETVEVTSPFPPDMTELLRQCGFSFENTSRALSAWAEQTKETKGHQIMERIASFQVDHVKLEKGLYISRIDGDITTFDLRFIKPNCPPYLENAAIHTMEHLFATYVRNSSFADNIIYFGPMGCRTGFYFLTRSMELSDVIALVQETMAWIAQYEGEIPGVSEVECGNWLDHDLAGAKTMAKEYSAVVANWTPEQMIY